ncbi:MAG: TolC family protein [Vicinamibacteria bacterium]|nr:TolC family protein [Vicinamibacteria bacterium]
MRERRFAAPLLLAAALCAVPAVAQEPEAVTFEQAVARALERNPSAVQAGLAVERARALLDEAKSVFRPQLHASAGRTILDDARGFDDNVTQPKEQWALSGTASFAFFAPARWAAKSQAGDRLGLARLSAEEVRRQVALLAGQAHIAALGAGRQLEIAERTLETARALEAHARTRFDAGQGTRLDLVRATQERATAEQRVQSAHLALQRSREALGIALFADAPLTAVGEPELRAVGDGAIEARPDLRLAEAELRAAERIAGDVWKSWAPEGVASFTPRHVSPAGLFEPASTWRATFELQIPIYDGTLGSTRRLRNAERDGARVRLEAARQQARSEARLAHEAVRRNEQIVATSRVAAESAAEALRITEVAWREGATSNLELVQAQQGARIADGVLALAEDALRRARLELLVALGQFPAQ